MAHDLDFAANGTARMMYAGDGGKPWHGLGVETEGAVNSIAAAKAAGLDWDVLKVPVYGHFIDPLTTKRTTKRVEGKYVTMRASDGAFLGIVDELYQVSSNQQCFQLLDEVIADLQLEAQYETAGALNGGRQVFMMLRLQKDIVVGGDRLSPYLGLFTGHDGVTALDVFPTAVRWVCANTVRMGFNQRRAGEGITLWHMGDWDAKIKEAKMALNLSLRQLDDFEALAQQLVDIPATPEMEDEFQRYLLPLVQLLTDDYKTPKLRSVPDKPGMITYQVPESMLAQSQKSRELKVSIFKQVRAEEDGSAWGLFNAGTGYADHKRPYMWTKGEARMNSALFGEGAKAKVRALQGIKAVSGLA